MYSQQVSNKIMIKQFYLNNSQQIVTFKNVIFLTNLFHNHDNQINLCSRMIKNALCEY